MKSNVSLFRRLGAMFYDTCLAFSLVFFIGLVTNALFGGMGDAFFYLITLPSIYLYFTISWVKGRQTIGMKAWKFQVIQPNQQSITHQQAFVRFLAGFISFLTLGSGFIYQLFNQNNLAWHDKISHTLLVKN
ncbi:transporter [Candidatus Thioglobus autotrophicus]|uniref:Transporter n=1 Tax=Candidatus Thioglobus autotrophicus TaxID=1705394 RepID=A0A0M5LEV4_9GAMM|nr:RDD family protein [Candidatus Thioglobus autotrophicus]ALE52866.1 transporter [Candidatus Thioglobus autotrophicus]WPE18468.1 RDD family protein [Candidatus Thioglobus autotrophicus]